jgi:cysteine desulfurase
MTVGAQPRGVPSPAAPSGPGQNPVYLDNNATTPLDPRVRAAMVEAMDCTGNPSSAHAAGARNRAAVEAARARVAGLLNAAPGDVVFTSGATESNNLVLEGLARGAGGRRRIVSCVTEHASVLRPLERLGRQGFDVTLVPVLPDGLPDLDALARALDGDALLVSVMAVNNETGVLAPLGEVAALAHAHGALVHTDATQLVAWGGLDTARVPVDLASLSGHKFHGPGGVGALFVRPSARPFLRPLLEGGGQEGGLRSGSLNTVGIVGLGVAAELAAAEGASAAPAVAARRDRLWALLAQAGAELNGSPVHRAPGTLNVTFPGVDPALLACAGVIFSGRSACSSAAASPSHVLIAMGLDTARAAAAVRLSLSRLTTDTDVDRAGTALRDAATFLRA